MEFYHLSLITVSVKVIIHCWQVITRKLALSHFLMVLSFTQQVLEGFSGCSTILCFEF